MAFGDRVREARGLRDRAQAAGDRNMVRAMNVELEGMGAPSTGPASGVRETATPAPLERAVPPAPRRGGRPKLPRCPHGNVEGRCPKCESAGTPAS